VRPSGASRASALAFLTAFVALATQVLVHRVVSVKLVNNLAFLVISLTMLGFAVSGVILSRRLPRLLAARGEAFPACAALFALSLVAAMALFYLVPPGAQWSQSRSEFVAAFLRLFPLALLFALPFVFAGLVLGALLSAPDLPARRVYGFDLLGSATGAPAVVPVLPALGAERALVLGGFLLLAGTLALFPPRGRGTRALVASAFLVSGIACLAPGRVFRMSYPPGSVLQLAGEPQSGVRLEHVGWDPVARIELSRIPAPSPDSVPWPYLVGDDPDFLARFRRILTQNNTAYTYAIEHDGRAESLRGIERTMYAAAFAARATPPERVLVVGVGGGFDVLMALRAGASEVTGVEVNASTLRVLERDFREYFRPWVEDPRVRLVHAEGRHYLATHPGPFDVLQLSGVDSVSGTPAAAHVFSENYLYTAEAFDLFLARLAPGGFMNMMRTEYVPPREMLRALVTAVAALRRAGVARPRDHVVTVTSNDSLFTALLVKREPFTDEELNRLDEWAGSSPFFAVSASPRSRATAENLYALFLSLDDPRLEAAFVARYPFDVRPVGDDRPFFFRYSRWGHLIGGDPARGVPLMEIGLLLLLAVAGGATIVCVLLPLRLLARQGLRVPHAGRFALYFAGLGLGFLLVEIAFLQKLGLFLGHPNHALSVVLSALLASSGLGALASGWVVRRLSGVRFVAYLLAAWLLAEHQLVLPRLGDGLALPLAARVLLVVLLVLPVGLLLGVFFPAGLDRLKGAAAPFAPWAWGLNGAFSVVAPILGVAWSVTWGVSSLLVVAAVVYVLTAPALPAEAPDPGRAG
jgi:spermidine synthase